MNWDIKGWAYQLFIACDQLVNVLITPFQSGAWADETMSARAWRMDQKGKAWGRVLRPVIDFLFLWQTDDHCRKAYEKERDRIHLPPEMALAMSSALYAVRLTWQDWRGHASCDGVHIDLIQAPSIMAKLGLVAIEYTPAVQVTTCREIAHATRDMTHEEVAAVRAWLKHQAVAVRAAFDLEGESL